LLLRGKMVGDEVELELELVLVLEPSGKGPQ
jgi:hypothetical protein